MSRNDVPDMAGPSIAARAGGAVLRFVWPPMRDGDLVQAARERLLVLFALVGAVVGPVTALGQMSRWREMPEIPVVVFCLSAIMITALLHLHLTRNFRRSAWIMVCGMLTATALAAAVARGPLAAPMLALVAIPIGTALLLGMRPALAVAAVTIAILIGLDQLQDRFGGPVREIDPRLWSRDLPFLLSMMTAALTAIAGAFHGVMEKTNIQLRAARDEANAANEAKSQFLANMSHELRTPLNGILGFADLLGDQPLTDEGRTHLRHIRSSGADLLTLVNDILEFSRAETGALQLERRPLEPRALVEELRARFLPRVQAKGLELETDLADDLPQWVTGDALRLRQLLGNLLDNAIKFTHAGRVRLSVSRAPGGDRLCFVVADSGIGIPAEVLPRLFERFTQADSSTARRYGGSGLGLSIVRAFAHLMEGEVTADSSPGNGSQFRVTLRLPAAAPPDSRPEQDMAAASPLAGRAAGSQHGHILLVEDSETNQLLFRTVLERAGHRVRVAGNGQAALDALGEEGFDLVLMDGQMPVMGGMDAARAIRGTDNAFSGIPIIALTANAADWDAEAFREAGMNDRLTKPVDLHHLLATVENWLSQGAKDRSAQ